MVKELWYEMLTTYRRLMHYGHGITLPNMVGAYYCYDNSIDLSSSQCVVRVLNDILVSQRDMCVLISKCNDIKHYVLSELREDDKHPQQPNLGGRIFVNLYDTNLQNALSDINELGEYLYSIHRKEIIANKFSVTNDIWNQFSAIEMQYINNIIESMQQH